MQRVYRVAPQYSQMRTLLAGGIQSSMQIARMGPTSFGAKFAASLGGAQEATKIYERASQTHAVAYHLLASFGNSNSVISIGKWPDYASIIGRLGTPETGIPDWSTLFGSVDLCSCTECRSTDGPAAYLVDILHFLKDRLLVDSVTRDGQGEIDKVLYKQRLVPGTHATVDMSAKDVLFERRPDLGDIELTCQNTNTPLPYIDLANEVLENAVAPPKDFSPFQLPNDAAQKLDSRRLVDVQTLFTPPLSIYAVINVMKQNEWWTIDEPAFTYTIRQEQSGVRVIARSLQTKGTAKDRAASPQYINIEAYNILGKQVYPWNLPFDLWSETVRTYLAHVGAGRYEFMEIFFSSNRRAVLNEPSIVHEFLGLTQFEAKLVTGEVTGLDGSPTPGPWNLWGFSAETLGPGNSIPDPANKSTPLSSGNWQDVLLWRVDVFLQQSGLQINELLNIVEVGNIFGGEVRLDIRPQEGQAQDTCDASKLSIIGAEVSVLQKIVQYVRLVRKLKDWSILDLGKVFEAFGFPAGPQDMETFLTKVSHIQRLMKALDLPLEYALAFRTTIETVAYTDHENEDEDAQNESLYSSIFRNQTICKQPDEVFTRDPNDLTGNLSGQSAPITAALNIGPLDFGLLLVDKNVMADDVLSLENLSKIFRHTILAKSLGVSIQDYLSLLKLVSSNPFASTDETVLFVERAQYALQSGFSLTELNYLLRHDFTTDSGINPSDDATSLVLDDVRTGLRTIAVENTFDTETVDNNGDLTKKKLALLNWDPFIISQAMGILNNTASFGVPLASDPSITFPETVQDKISYDATSSRLAYSRVMTAGERDILMGLTGASQDFIKAVQDLYRVPRTFFARNMSTFSISDFAVGLAAFPDGIKIPTSLRKKVYFDPSTSKLHSIGALQDSERETLLALAIEPAADSAYIKAINDLYNTADNITPASGDSFVMAADVSEWFDAAVDSTGTAIAPSMRFMVILKKLLPYLRDKLSNQLIRQKVGQSISTNSQIVENLLTTWISYSAKPINAVFRSTVFVDSSDKSPMTHASFSDQFQAMTLLTKVGMLITKFKLSATQLNWIFTFRTRSGDPTAGWLDLNDLPLIPMESGIQIFAGWERLYSLTRLRDGLVGGEMLLDGIFALARTASGTAESVIQLLATNFKVQLNDLDYLVGPEGFNLKFPSAYQDEIAMTRMIRAIKLFGNVGCTPADGKLLSSVVMEEKQARATKQAVKSKYDQDTWDTIAQPLCNILRDAQRALLVAYLLAHPQPIANPSWRTSNDLYAYFLMDVEMGPCQMTSRIKQAISSVQLFAQRCLMNLELEVQANEEVDVFWKEWDWMKSFRIAGANRLVFEMPENYLEWSVRDDKTEFFKDLESELQQSDITQDSAETAVLNYLEKLDQVAHMEVVSFYHQEEFDGHGQRAVDIMHIFARTKGKPQRFFYCQRVDSSYWTGWEKMDIDIQGDHLIPVMWNRRLYLFWAIFTEKQKRVPITLPSADSALPTGDTFWEIKIAWTERKGPKWQPKVISDAYLVCPKSNSIFDEVDMVPSRGRTLITFKAAPDPNTGELWIRCLNPQPLGFFYFNGVRGQPEIQTPYPRTGNPFADAIIALFESIYYTTVPPSQSVIKNMWFGEDDASDGKLWVRTEILEKLSILDKTPGGAYNLAVAHQDRIFQSQRPFWFQHDQKSFFVEPRDLIWNPVIYVPVSRRVNPGLLDGRVMAPYYDTPVIKPRPEIYPRPDIGGQVSFTHTFDYGSDLNANIGAVARGTALPNSLSPSVRPLAAAALRGVKVIGEFKPIRKIDTSILQFPPVPISITLKEYKFSVFYHPFVPELIRTLNRDGLDGLYQRPLQQAKIDTFVADYAPSASWLDKNNIPQELVDFDDNVYAVYNWELFFHVPVMIADRLSKNQKFQEAQKWYHYVFDPTDTSPLSVPQRYWRTKKLFEVSAGDYANQMIKSILNFLAKGGDPAEKAKLSPDELKYLDLLEKNVARWRKDPFKPFMIARARVTAFQKSVVMKYLDNLIAWGDALFRGDTIELINEATQIYILAADILGQRPVEMSSRAIPEVQTYNSLEPKLDAYSNALVRIEELVPPSADETMMVPTKPMPLATSPSVTYFCVPKNEKLLGYWDTVSERLFKIRHCMNLQGIVRELPLFEPPIDPALLIRAAASGADLSSAISDINAPLPHHRYMHLSSKAAELCQELKALGSAILSNLEKKDAGQLALLNSGQSMKLLDAVRQVKVQQVTDSLWIVDALNKSKAVLQQKYDFYNNKDLMNAWEITHMAMEGAALVLNLLDSGTQPVAAVLHLIPDAKLGAPTSIGVTIGGANVGKSSSKFGKFIEKAGVVLARGSSMVSTIGGYQRRKDEWDLQFRIADAELKQLGSQISSAEVKQAIAEKDLDNHDLQIKNAKDTDDFMRNKYTNVELYDWMLSQLSTTYFQTYQLVYETAKRAERAFAFELGVNRQDFISFDYWDSMRKGLCAGERLFCDLKRMDMAYLDQDLREYEISRSVSLAQLDPIALIQLRQSGSCFFTIPEAIFDLDFPGHYMRRIKTVSVTIPCVAGPYISISSTLYLLQSSIRTANTLSNGKYARRDNDTRFSDIFGQFQSIATSTGVNDAGVFDPSLRDERYLPFERSGAISSWKLEISMAFKQFDYDTISDVLLTIRYTAREGGALLRSQAETELQLKALDAIALAEAQAGLARLFSVPDEFPDLWYKFLRGTVAASADATAPAMTQQATLPLTSLRFPYLFSGASSIAITKIALFVRVRTAFVASHNADSLRLTLSDSVAVPGDALALSVWNPTGGGAGAGAGTVFRASKVLDRPLGNYYLTGSLNGTDMINSDAISLFLFVCYYKVKWT